MNTTEQNTGTFCDACARSYYWDNWTWKSWLKKGENGQCTNCCVRCTNACGVSEERECVDCASDGVVLESLRVKRGWWRATNKSQTVYECSTHGCRGGTSTKESEQCKRGYVGFVFPVLVQAYMLTVGRFVGRATKITTTASLMADALNAQALNLC